MNSPWCRPISAAAKKTSAEGLGFRPDFVDYLAVYLRDRHVRELYICGLATDYCVQAIVLEALEQGF